MRLSKMQMTGQKSGLFFCLLVLIEMRMTYFRRMNSQEKCKENSRHRDVAKKDKSRAGKERTWVNFWGQ
jgi:hypothetical protein